MSRLPDGTSEIRVENLPTAAPDAIGAYRLEIYRLHSGQAPTLVATLAPVDSKISWIDAAPPLQTDGYALILVDPIGRRSQPALTEPPPPD